MKKITLLQTLQSQDMSKEQAKSYADAVDNGEDISEKDPIAAIIVNSFKNNEGEDATGIISDLDYAISQLTRAKNTIEKSL
jgi:hypothetical protein